MSWRVISCDGGQSRRSTPRIVFTQTPFGTITVTGLRKAPILVKDLGLLS
jgi:hypothetical protein